MAQLLHIPSPPDLSGCCHQNWDLDAQSPIAFNPKADIHACIAWCWGEAEQLKDLSRMLDAGHANTSMVLNIFNNRLTPLAEMLDYLGTVTHGQKRATLDQQTISDVVTQGAFL